MAYQITKECINCDMCEPECPNQAITFGEEIYEIDPDRCTECVGFYDKPTCVSVCAINCVVLDPEHQETPEQLKKKAQQLHPELKF
ncbi:YfhL family 4Fe-4S dicluster ferredoxin [Dongshaea marina]|uniref:YfhL family 4Fe-4S dicluster ferredoxin n=1 Tax=Dongshaea marina TaxID=2047966 RepID=UPI000D3EBB09|nr:YfhL family 4Fe-4S dicluster ferredoxin [Dongshaea marina]